MEAYHIKSLSMPASFAAAEALFSETKTALSSDSLIHAYHDEVERYAVEQGRPIVHALMQVHMDLRGQAVAVEPVVGNDGQERTHVRPDTARRPELIRPGLKQEAKTAKTGPGLVCLKTSASF